MSLRLVPLWLVWCTACTGSSLALPVDGPPDDPSPTPIAPSSFQPIPVDAAFVRTRAEAVTGAPGLAIAIVSGGEVVLAEGFGDNGVGGAVGPNTLFNCGSVSKMFTGLAVAGLVHDGVVGLDDPVPAHAPELGLRTGFDPDSVRVRDVVAHTSGIGDWTTEPYTWVNGLAEEFLVNDDQPLWSPPGAVWNYSNRGTNLAGLVVQNAAGQPFPGVLADEVFGPLGFPDATARPNVVSQRDHARGQSSWGLTTPADFVPANGPATGVWLSAADLGVLLTSLVGTNPALDPGLHQEWTRPLAETRGLAGQSYGYGLQHDDGYVEPMLGHSGSFPGYVASVTVWPERGFGIGIVANGDDADIWALQTAIEDATIGPNAMREDVRLELDTATLAGTYHDPWQLGTMTVSGSPAALSVQGDAGSFSLYRIARGSYYGEHPTHGWIDVTFWPDETGAAQRMVSRAGVASK